MTTQLQSGWRIATVPAIANHLGVSPLKVLRWIDNGELNAVNIGTSTDKRPVYRIEAPDFEAFCRSRSTAPAAPAAVHQQRRRKRPEHVKSFV